MRFVWLALLGIGMASECAESQTPAPPPESPEMTAALKGVALACKGQATALCPNMKGEHMAVCLKANLERLTPGCKDAVAKVPDTGPAP